MTERDVEIALVSELRLPWLPLGPAVGRSEAQDHPRLWLEGSVGSGSCPMGVGREAAFQHCLVNPPCRHVSRCLLVPAEPCTRCKRASRPYTSAWIGLYGCTKCRMRGVASVADASVRRHIRAAGLRLILVPVLLCRGHSSRGLHALGDGTAKSWVAGYSYCGGRTQGIGGGRRW